MNYKDKIANVEGVPVKTGSNFPFRILLADDDAQLLEVHGDVLTLFGYHVDTASNGVEAWNSLHETDYDLLITDNNMPRLTGMDLIKKVRSAGISMPIILASGTVPLDELKQNSKLTIDSILVKPFYLDELLATVKKVLGFGDRENQSMTCLYGRG